MVSSSYFARNPTQRSEFKRFFDQKIIPVAIDGAACLDIGFANVVRQLRRNPKTGLGLALGMGILLAVRHNARRTSEGTAN